MPYFNKSGICIIAIQGFGWPFIFKNCLFSTLPILILTLHYLPDLSWLRFFPFFSHITGYVWFFNFLSIKQINFSFLFGLSLFQPKQILLPFSLSFLFNLSLILIWFYLKILDRQHLETTSNYRLPQPLEKQSACTWIPHAQTDNIRSINWDR